MADIRPVAGQARQQAPQLLLAQCLAAEVPVGRRPQLLACSAGGQLAVAAAGSQLLLIDISLTAAAQPCSVALLLGCPANITAVALSSSPHEQWAAALAGSAAHFVPASSKGASSPACGISVPSGTEAWQACAWHPSRPVCALLSSQQLQLASPTPANGSSSGSGSSSIYATIGPRSQASNFGATPVAGRCCLAWLDAPGSGSDCWGQLVVSWELHLELLLFGSGKHAARSGLTSRRAADGACYAAASAAHLAPTLVCKALLLLHRFSFPLLCHFLAAQTGNCWIGASCCQACLESYAGWLLQALTASL